MSKLYRNSAIFSASETGNVGKTPAKGTADKENTKGRSAHRPGGGLLLDGEHVKEVVLLRTARANHAHGADADQV
jgi:hypothetical protein